MPRRVLGGFWPLDIDVEGERCRWERDVEELRGELLVVWLVAGGLVAVCLITVLMWLVGWLVGCWYCCCGVVEGPTGDVVAL
ncbi:hypothetical protein ACLB2K_029486 [Fragaria x ananassa]